MLHAKHLCQMPEVRKGDASSLRQLFNNVSSQLNALQALLLSVPIQYLMLNDLMLATLDPEITREFERRYPKHCRISLIPGIKMQSS